MGSRRVGDGDGGAAQLEEALAAAAEEARRAAEEAQRAAALAQQAAAEAEEAVPPPTDAQTKQAWDAHAADTGAAAVQGKVEYKVETKPGSTKYELKETQGKYERTDTLELKSGPRT